eukprot:2798265-Rhodomonas_salina.1
MACTLRASLFKNRSSHLRTSACAARMRVLGGCGAQSREDSCRGQTRGGGSSCMQAKEQQRQGVRGRRKEEGGVWVEDKEEKGKETVSYTHLRAHETEADL